MNKKESIERDFVELNRLTSKYRSEPEIRQKNRMETLTVMLKCLIYSLLGGQVIGSVFIYLTSPVGLPFANVYFNLSFQLLCLIASLLLLPMYYYYYKKDKLWLRLAMREFTSTIENKQDQ